MTIRVQHIPEQFAAAAAAQSEGTLGTDTSIQHEPLSRVHTGAVTFTAGQSEAVQHGTTTHVHSTAGTPGGSVLATLARAGTELTVELEPGNPSSRTLVSLALREGVLVRDPSGSLRDATATTTEAQQHGADTDEAQAEQEPQLDGFNANAFDAEDDRLWAEDIAPLPQHSYDAAVGSMVAVIALGRGSMEDTAHRFAASAGIDTVTALDYVQQGTAMYERAVARAVGRVGIESDSLQQFYDHVRTKPGQLQNAIQQMVHMRDMSAWRSLAMDFKGKAATEVA